MTLYEILTLIAIIGIAVQQGWQMFYMKRMDKAENREAEQVKRCEMHQEQTDSNTEAIRLLVQSKATIGEISEIKTDIASIKAHIGGLTPSIKRIEDWIILQKK